MAVRRVGISIHRVPPSEKSEKERLSPSENVDRRASPSHGNPVAFKGEFHCSRIWKSESESLSSNEAMSRGIEMINDRIGSLVAGGICDAKGARLIASAVIAEMTRELGLTS